MKRQRIRRGLILMSFLLFPAVLYYLSPVLPLQGASQGIVAGSLLVFLGLSAGSLFLGRAFCGWLCPAAGVQEACFSIRDRRIKGGNWIKYLVWVPWLALLILMAVKSGGFRRVDLLYQTEHGLSVMSIQAYIVYYSVVGLIVILALTFGKRSFCHHLCWMAPFMILGRRLRNLFRWPSLRLRAVPEACSACGRCSKECPMSLQVQSMVQSGRMEHDECILCGNCVDVCAKSAISFCWRERRDAEAKPTIPVQP